MQLGISAKTFAAQGAREVLTAVRAAGYGAAQFNMACLGLASMPDAIAPEFTRNVAEASRDTGVAIAAVSATYNMIHPAGAARDEGMRRLGVMIGAARGMGTGLVTLCTGTRDSEDRWRHHRDNQGPEAWRDLMAEMQRAVALAETHAVDLGIEPELANVVNSAAADEERKDIVARAVDLLGDRIVMAHAKDRAGDGGEGRPVVFRHGLGGDDAQVAEMFPALGFRRLTLECRAQGYSEAGGAASFSIAAFTGDVMAFAESRGLARLAVGGISMGAAIALRIAVRWPERITALILARPAWLWERAPSNMQVFVELSRYLADGRRADFEASDAARLLGAEAPDNLVSLRKFFESRDQLNTARLLAAIAADGPGITEKEVRALNVPALAIGTAMDLIYPISHARTLAGMISGARFTQITPKVTDRPRHAAEFGAAVSAFLGQEGTPT
jgi:sugar phosphate isomerase/epimerase